MGMFDNIIFDEFTLLDEGKHFDLFNKNKEYRDWKKPKNFIKNLSSDMKSISKRPANFDQEAGNFEELRPWLLDMAKNAKDMDRIKYLRQDANTGKAQLKKRIERIKAVQNGTPDRYTHVPTVERWIEKGCTVKKLEDHIKWLDTEYKKALNDRAKELRKNESTLFDRIELI